MTMLTRTAPAPGLRALNQPRIIAVEATRNDLPRAVAWRGGMQPVRRIHDTWRIDDEWWREHPVSRRYYRIELAGGHRITIYQDLVDKVWYAQHYSPPKSALQDRRAG
jgi:hypothetical protein